MSAPRLSIVVVGYDMARELPRTIQSLSPPYQQGVEAGDIEIIVADNGSPTPVRPEDFDVAAPVIVIRVDDGGVSPCVAINRAAAMARGELIAVMIDGARMASPGLVATALEAMRLDPRAFVATVGFHLGPDLQQRSVLAGYDRAVEDRLLADIAWPADGYRLFEISTLAGSYRDGAGGPPMETTFFVMGRDRFLALGGFDERFEQPGGGLANFDFFARALADRTTPFLMLVGEGTFHQLHHGASTQAGGVRRKVSHGGPRLAQLFADEYRRLTGADHEKPTRAPTLYGRITHPRVPALFFPGAQ
ncbi:glycosyltransferase family 2 protein [Brevundimonas sp.]|uniref:glycosyltransferase family 2 protein n=1 Tax=Brevundimonas sp. TaxID=1871086 RepID=UPI0035B26B39